MEDKVGEELRPAEGLRRKTRPFRIADQVM